MNVESAAKIIPAKKIRGRGAGPSPRIRHWANALGTHRKAVEKAQDSQGE